MKFIDIIPFCEAIYPGSHCIERSNVDHFLVQDAETGGIVTGETTKVAFQLTMNDGEPVMSEDVPIDDAIKYAVRYGAKLPEVKLSREAMVDRMVDDEAAAVFDGGLDSIKDLLRNGCTGYSALTDAEVQEEWDTNQSYHERS